MSRHREFPVGINQSTELDPEVQPDNIRPSKLGVMLVDCRDMELDPTDSQIRRKCPAIDWFDDLYSVLEVVYPSGKWMTGNTNCKWGGTSMSLLTLETDIGSTRNEQMCKSHLRKEDRNNPW